MGMRKQLTALEAARLKTPGRHAAGGNLFLNIRTTPAGFLSRTWSFKYEQGGERHEIGLGSVVRVSYAKARLKAARLRLMLDEGHDPLPTRVARPLPTETFRARANAFIAANGAKWSPKHRRQWHKAVDDYLKPLANLPVAAVDTAAVLSCLNPLWQRIPGTAQKIRGNIEAVLDSAKALGLRSDENPAVWMGHLANILPGRDSRAANHHEAMAYNDVPRFMRELRVNESTAARALEFTILTAARSGEVRGARWTELDLDAKVWTVPAARMKGGKEHRVPLCDRAMEILESLAARRTSDIVFAGARHNTPIGKSAMPALVPPPATTHGFRSSFASWAFNETKHPREIVEQALAHRIGNGVEQAYRRSDALSRRRELMDLWVQHCEPGGNVVPLRTAS